MDKKQYTVSEHYIPKCYLKNFSIREGEDYFTYCLFNKSNVPKWLNIKNICVVNDLYELEIFGEYVDRNDIEDGFIDIETRYDNFFRNVIANIDKHENIILSPENFELIRNFCSLMVFRSKYMIEALANFGEYVADCHPADLSQIRNITKDIDPAAVENEIIPYVNKCYAYSIAYNLISKMLDTQSLSPEVQNYKSALGEHYCFLYSADRGFITSDVPVVNLYGEPAECLGFDDFMCFPLSTNCCIAFLEDNKFNGQVINITKD